MQEQENLLQIAVQHLNSISVTGHENAKRLVIAIENIDRVLYQLQHPPDEQIEDKQE